MTWHVDSEVGRLRQVLLHRPGTELQRLTAANRAALLFDDVVWADQARREHDGLAAVLRAAGVEVRYLEDLLGDVMTRDTARKWVVERTVSEHRLGPALAARVRDHLDDLDGRRLVAALIGGLTTADVRDGYGLAWSMLRPGDFVVPPLPNQMFTRDSSTWVYGGVTLNPMSTAARRRETVLVEAVYRFHPAFEHESFRAWLGGVDAERAGAALEGGDVLVVGDGVVLVGVGERTAAATVEQLAASLFTADAARAVVAVELPHERSYMHLDTVMTMVDAETFLVYPGILDDARTWSLRPGDAPGEIAVARRPNATDAIAGEMGLDAIRIVPTGGDVLEASREQWDDGNNVLALEPGVVVAYERNVETNVRLQRAGIEVVTIEGSELPRGRGGPRCLTCPLVREAVGEGSC